MRRAVAAVFAAVVLATGCEATVATGVDVDSTDSVSAEVTVTLTGSAAEAFSRDVALLNRLEKLIEDRAGATASREVSDERVSFHAEVDPDRVADASGLTGVAGLDVAADGDDARLTVGLVAPSELTAALADTPDPDAVPLLLENTSVVLEVRTGGVRSVSGFDAAAPGVSLVNADGVVTLSRTLDSAPAGTLTVVAAPVASGPPWVLIGAALLVAGAAVACWRRRR